MLQEYSYCHAERFRPERKIDIFAYLIEMLDLKLVKRNYIREIEKSQNSLIKFYFPTLGLSKGDVRLLYVGRILQGVGVMSSVTQVCVVENYKLKTKLKL